MKLSLAQRTKQRVAAIVAPINALDARWQALGTEKAFDPNDPTIGPLFKDLWDASFHRRFTMEEQEAIIAEMQARQPVKLQRMREISIASEAELEKGCAEHAIEAAEAILQKGEFKGSMPLGKSILDKRDLIRRKIELVYQLCDSFPYHTYDMLHRGELAMVKALDIDKQTVNKGLHVIVEAGALPFTAVFSSIERDDGPVLATISDPKACALAKQFVSKLESLGVLAPNAVMIVQHRHQDIGTLSLGRPPFLAFPKPCMATVTQMVPSKAAVEQAVRGLTELGIDTIVARDSKGLVKMLYQPFDDLKIPRSTTTRIEALPFESIKKDESYWATSYNASCVLSSRSRVRQPELVQFRDVPLNQHHIS